MLARILVASLLLAASLGAATTTVSGTVTDANGVAATGRVLISWPSFVTAAGVLVPAGSKSVNFTAGALSVALEANVGATPSGTSYTLRFSGATMNATEYWIVPATGTATIAACRTSIPPTPSAIVNLSALSTAGVSLGDILTVQAGPVWARLAAGAEGRVLKVVSGVPAWAVEAGAGSGGIDCTAPISVSIASGVVAITDQACYAVDTEGAAASDDVTSFTCSVGTIFVIQAADSARTVRIVDGNGVLDAPADFDLDHVSDLWQGLCHTTNQVVEISRANAR